MERNYQIKEKKKAFYIGKIVARKSNHTKRKKKRKEKKRKEKRANDQCKMKKKDVITTPVLRIHIFVIKVL